ncbi:hypothetical protein BAUCODRAFT_129795 [Baudoinia panamericana UAMH 10762]|uniref:Uncharacterized protein n=1 Tax=Baudoinia panamericana (strain UAMH 10762) TaxID=717646 RepID=M2NFL0_BAUPA|nr:uncharacterized protein BAUCODRAFT_129795 [Baudoinia panamericana UAMH 10762]EMC98019.1 hypothetical protein BAUCODRAFT_129795 [Baudoinia panamericana UAMH 10762]
MTGSMLQNIRNIAKENAAVHCTDPPPVSTPRPTSKLPIRSPVSDATNAQTHPQQANSGRRLQSHGRLAALTQSPPRASHMQRMSNIFKGTAPCQSRSESHPDSTTSESAQRLRADSAVSVAYQPTPVILTQEPFIAQHDNANASAQTSSSDEWTGDDIYLPRSARRRDRERRLAIKQHQTQQEQRRERISDAMSDQHIAKSHGDAKPVIPACPTTPPSSRSSRFQRLGGPWSAPPKRRCLGITQEHLKVI